MSEINYPKMVNTLAKDGNQIIDDLSPKTAHELHMAIGVAGEAGELLDAIKKSSIYNKPVDVKNVIEELGDLEFYMEGLRQSLNITRQQTIDANVAKLAVRYESGEYSNEQAQQRADKEA